MGRDHTQHTQAAEADNKVALLDADTTIGTDLSPLARAVSQKGA